MDLRKKEFQLPENLIFDPDTLTSSYGRITAEPLERGFGTTIGNALRRVLLSSISGSAVTDIRIDGVLHEYASIPGVTEDIIDIIFNIKKLKFKLYSKGPSVFSIKVKGPGKVKGKDVITGAHAKVFNPDQEIATLENKATFNAELTVENGKGYVISAKDQLEDKSVDVINIDAIYTPIKKVNYWVEGARVGRSTDFDKLIMDIWTDGSITPPQALTQAADILMGHLSLFRIEEESLDGDEKVAELQENNDDEIAIYNKNLLKSVDELELSVRSYNCLKNADISTIADLVQRTEQEMLRTKNFGRKSLNEIKEIISIMGLHLNMKVDMEALQANSVKDGADDAA
jgi:DNA-directed RNA polymerase subunit alpha